MNRIIYFIYIFIFYKIGGFEVDIDGCRFWWGRIRILLYRKWWLYLLLGVVLYEREEFVIIKV